MKRCESCNGRGYGIMLNTKRNLLEIQRCDLCQKFDGDKSAKQRALEDFEEFLENKNDRISQQRFISEKFKNFLKQLMS